MWAPCKLRTAPDAPHSLCTEQWTVANLKRINDWAERKSAVWSVKQEQNKRTRLWHIPKEYILIRYALHSRPVCLIISVRACLFDNFILSNSDKPIFQTDTGLEDRSGHRPAGLESCIIIIAHVPTRSEATVTNLTL